MARWTDVRLPAEESPKAVAALTSLRPLNLTIDLSPPAAGPEIELQIEGHAETDVVALLRAAGVSVLASRTRLAEGQEAVFARLTL